MTSDTSSHFTYGQAKASRRKCGPKDSREAILSRIKEAQPKARPLPDIPVFDIPGSPLPNFICHLKGFDGDYRLFPTREAAAEWLQERLPKDGRKIFSSVPDVRGNVVLSDFRTPAEMNVIDVCVGDSILSVGETGSILVDVRTLGDPAAALFSTDLYLFVDRAKMLPGIQEAYAKMDMKAMQYSSFFSGPSATADIEAVHITGAQAQISLTALVYGCSPEDEKAVKEIMTRLPQGTSLGQPDAPVLKLVRPTDPAAGQDSV